MASQVGIINMALSHLAIGKEIATVTENSQEATAANRFYDIALDATLRDFPWPFITRILTLALVEEDPNDEWDFSYRYPSDCLMVRRILSGIRNDNRQTRVNYKVASDSAGLLIFTDEEDAQIEYSVRETDPQKYPADFVLAFSYYLAALIAPRITAGDQFKLGEKALKNYYLEVSRAASRAFNEQQEEEMPDSEFIRERA